MMHFNREADSALHCLERDRACRFSFANYRISRGVLRNGCNQGHQKGDVGPVVQVQHLQLLAKLYIRRNRHDMAAQVWQILAIRRSGVADQAISLTQRTEAYQNAVIEVPDCINILLGRPVLKDFIRLPATDQRTLIPSCA